MTIQKILVPTDFSACATHAASIATTIAMKVSAEIIFLHLFPDPDSAFKTHKGQHESDQRMNHPEVAIVKQRLDELVKDVGQKGVNAKGVLVYDRGNESIEEYADSYHVDLIVMGSHGARGLVEWFRGSNAQHVMVHTDVPILVVKDTNQQFDINDILFASTFEEDVLPALQYITEFAKIWNATIHLLNLNLAILSVDKEDLKEEMCEVIDKFPDSRFQIHFSEHNNEEVAIHDMAEKLQVDIITLTPHDRDGVIKFLSHSVAENLVYHEEHPVLVLPEN